MNIKVDNPCSQNWNKMQALKNGRHCQQCEKTVINFTGMSDQKIQEIIKASSGKICGRFTTNQLNRPLGRAQSKKPSPYWPILAGSLLSIPMLAQEKPAHLPVCPAQMSVAKVLPDTIPGPQRELPKKKEVTQMQAPEIVVSGKVLDEETGETLPTANVVLKNGRDEVIVSGATNFDGIFKITADTAKLRRLKSMEVTFVGYEKHVESLDYEGLLSKSYFLKRQGDRDNPDELQIRKPVTLLPGADMMGEVVVVGMVTNQDSRATPAHGFSNRGLINVLVDWVKSW